MSHDNCHHVLLPLSVTIFAIICLTINFCVCGRRSVRVDSSNWLPKTEEPGMLMAAQRNMAGPPNALDGGQLLAPILPNLAVPVAVPVTALPAGPVLPNLAGAPVPLGDGFDIPSGLMGSPPKKSDISFTIWP